MDLNMDVKKIFWSGLKAFIPAVLTIAIVYWIIQSVDGFFGGLIQWLLPDAFYFKGSGFLLGIVLIFGLGILVNAWFISSLYRWLDRLVKKIPVIKSIYNAIQELVDFFDQDKTQGQQTVLVDTPLGRVIGFMTRDSIRDLPFGGASDSDEVLVYVPLSYQIGGIMLSISRDKLTVIDWPMDTAMSFVLTAGMTNGASPAKDQSPAKAST